MEGENELMISGIKEAIDAGTLLAGPQVPLMDNDSRVPFVVLPAGCEVEDIEKLLPSPTRKRADVSVTTTDSFIAYSKKHGSLDECVIYAEVDAEKSKCILRALMNDNGADHPKWRDHRCTFAPALAIEWSRWIGSNKKQMNQADFATWLEDNQIGRAHV